jgi:hypothetical protein
MHSIILFNSRWLFITTVLNPFFFFYLVLNGWNKKHLKFVVCKMCVKEKYSCPIQRLVLVLLFFMSNVRHAHLGSKGDDQTFWRKKKTPWINKMSSVFSLHYHAIPWFWQLKKTWLLGRFNLIKASSLKKTIPILTKIWGMKNMCCFWLVHLIKMDFIIRCQSKHFVKKNKQNKKSSSRWLGFSAILIWH